MRILILTQFFYPEERTAPTNLFKLSIDLVDKGHSVSVLTGIPNHPYGRFYDGYKFKMWQKSKIKGVEIIRVPLFPDHSVSVIRRTLCYVSFALSASFIGSYLLRNIKIDVIFSYLPPLTIAIPCRIISRYHNSPVVFWMTDLWPENLIATGKNLGRYTVKIIKRFEKWVYDKGQKITVNSPGFIPNLVEKGVNIEKISIISDCADPELFYPTTFREDLAAKYNLKGKFNIVYAGNLGKVQGLQHVLNAASRLQNISDIKFVFIGDGTEADYLKEFAKNKKLNNVRFISRKPLDEISSFLALADVLLLHLIDNKVFRMQMPSKLIAYMACGKPILCAFEGTASELVRNSNAGLTCQASNDIDISRTVKEFYKMDKSLLKEMGENARIIYEENYTRDIQVENVENILRDVVQVVQ